MKLLDLGSKKIKNFLTCYIPSFIDKFFCKIGCHNWIDGPGYPCASCGIEDELFK